jgi:hypothetical protein
LVVKVKKSTQNPSKVVADSFIKEVALCRDNVAYCSGLSPQREVKFHAAWYPRTLTVSIDTKNHQLEVIAVDELSPQSAELLNITEEFRRGVFNKFIFQIELTVEDDEITLSLEDCVDKIFDDFLSEVALSGLDFERIFNLGLLGNCRNLSHFLSPGICSLGLINSAGILSKDLLHLLMTSYSLDASEELREINDFTYNVLKRQKGSLKELILGTFSLLELSDDPSDRKFCLNSKHQEDAAYLEALKAIIVLESNYLPLLQKRQLIAGVTSSVNDFDKFLELFKEVVGQTLPTSTEDKFDLFFDWVYNCCFSVIDQFQYDDLDGSDFNREIMDGDNDYFLKEHLSTEQFILFEKLVGVDLKDIFSEKDDRESLLSFFNNSLGVDSFGIFVPSTGSGLDNLLRNLNEINYHHTKLSYKIVNRIASYCANKMFVENSELPLELVVDENRVGTGGGFVSDLMGTFLTYCSVGKEMFLDKLIVRFHKPNLSSYNLDEEVKSFKIDLIKQLMDLNKNLVIEFQYKPLTERRKVETNERFRQAMPGFQNIFCKNDLKDFYSPDQIERISFKALKDTEYFDNYSGIKNARDVILVPVTK